MSVGKQVEKSESTYLNVEIVKYYRHFGVKVS